MQICMFCFFSRSPMGLPVCLYVPCDTHSQFTVVIGGTMGGVFLISFNARFSVFFAPKVDLRGFFNIINNNDDDYIPLCPKQALLTECGAHTHLSTPRGKGAGFRNIPLSPPSPTTLHHTYLRFPTGVSVKKDGGLGGGIDSCRSL